MADEAAAISNITRDISEVLAELDQNRKTDIGKSESRPSFRLPYATRAENHQHSDGTAEKSRI